MQAEAWGMFGGDTHFDRMMDNNIRMAREFAGLPDMQNAKGIGIQVGKDGVKVGITTGLDLTQAVSFSSPSDASGTCLAGSCSNSLSPELLRKIMQVESGGNPNVVGDNGKALGPYQIWESYFKDAVEYNPEIVAGGKSYQDVTDPEFAEQVIRSYMDRYATEKRLGRTPTAEDIARIHNGGPNGYKNDKTKAYWEKVKAAR